MDSRRGSIFTYFLLHDSSGHCYVMAPAGLVVDTGEVMGTKAVFSPAKSTYLLGKAATAGRVQAYCGIGHCELQWRGDTAGQSTKTWWHFCSTHVLHRSI